MASARILDQPEMLLPALRANGWLIRSSEDRVVCYKRDQVDKVDCPDLEAQYCCPAEHEAPSCPTDNGEWTTWSNTGWGSILGYVDRKIEDQKNVKNSEKRPKSEICKNIPQNPKLGFQTIKNNK